jgi:DNA-directed RNA polymerase subunit L
MEIKVIEEGKKKMIFEVIGESHTLCNAMKDELYNDKHVNVASYMVEHPLKNIPKMIVETDGEVSPRNATIAAAQRLQKNVEKFSKAVSSEIK